MYDNIRPLSDFVVINRFEEKEEETDGGIILAQGQNENVCTGKVVAVGNGKMTLMGYLLPMTTEVGDTVMFRKHVGTELERELIVLRENEILGIVEDNDKEGA